jgi:hypothetical protein
MSDDIINIEKIVESGIVQFMKYIKQMHNINADQVDLGQFMTLYRARRTFRATQDTFLHICKFLHIDEMLRFSTLCREYMEYYPFVWDILHRRYFPESIAHPLEYKEVKVAISLEYYYDTVLRGGLGMHSDHEWKELNKSEQNMEKYNDLMTKAINNPDGDANATDYFTEYKKYSTERDNIFIRMGYNTKNFLINHHFSSSTDALHTKYYTLKPELNCRVYGLDHEKDKVKVRNTQRWMSGKYNSRPEYNYDPSIIGEDDDQYIYIEDLVPGERCRYRKRPDYIDSHGKFINETYDFEYDYD